MAKTNSETITLKKKLNVPWKAIGTTVGIVLLVLLGVLGTIKYQEFITNTELNGVLRYQESQCDAYMNEDKSAKWLECDTVRVENNQ